MVWKKVVKPGEPVMKLMAGVSALAGGVPAPTRRPTRAGASGRRHRHLVRYSMVLPYFYFPWGLALLSQSGWPGLNRRTMLPSRFVPIREPRFVPEDPLSHQNGG